MQRSGDAQGDCLIVCPLTNASLCYWTHNVCDVTARHHIPVCKPTFWRSLLTSALPFRDFVPRLELLAHLGIF